MFASVQIWDLPFERTFMMTWNRWKFQHGMAQFRKITSAWQELHALLSFREVCQLHTPVHLAVIVEDFRLILALFMHKLQVWLVNCLKARTWKHEYQSTSGPLEAPVWALHSGEHLPQEMARFHEFNHARIKWKWVGFWSQVSLGHWLVPCITSSTKIKKKRFQTQNRFFPSKNVKKKTIQNSTGPLKGISVYLVSLYHILSYNIAFLAVSSAS